MSDIVERAIDRPGERVTIRQVTLTISQAALLAALFFSPWVLEWAVSLPGLHTASALAANAPKLRLSDVAAAISIGTWLLAGAPRARDLFSPRRRVWSLSLIGLMAWAAASTLWANEPSTAIALTLRLILWMCVAWRMACDPLPPAGMARVLLISLGVQSVVGVWQFAIQHYVGLTDLGELPVTLNYPNVSVIVVGAQPIIRAYGLSGHPNVLGGFAVVALTIGTGWLWQAAGRGRQLGVSVWLLGLLVLSLTFSRSAWLGGLIGFGAWARSRPPLMHKPIGRGLIIGVSMAVAWLMVFGPLLLQRLDVIDHPTERVSIDERLRQVTQALTQIRTRPLIGAGEGNFNVIGVDGQPARVHNVPLLIAADLGLPGLGFWLIGVGGVFAAWLDRLRRSPHSIWAAVFGVALSAMLVIAQFDYYWWTSSQGVYVWAVVTGWLMSDAV